MKFLAGLILGVFFGVAALLGQGLHYQMSMEEVKAAAGEPTSSLERSGRAIWIYPDGGRVEFENGEIVTIQNMLMAAEAERVAAEQAAAAAELQAEAEAQQKYDDEMAAAEAEFAAANAGMVEEFSNAIEDFESSRESGNIAGTMGLGPPEPMEYWLGLGVQALLGLGVTVVVLKVSFKWADLHADWGQMFMPALIDMFAGVTVRASAYLLWQTDQLYRIDDGVAFFALIFALRSFTHASTWSRAVTVAMVAKLANIVVWSLLSVVLLQTMFG